MDSAIALEAPVWEIIARGTAVYFVMAVLFRFLPKRHIGRFSPNDLLALVIIGGLMADAIAVGSQSTPDLLLMVVVVLVWDYVSNWLEYRFPRFRRVAQDSPTLLIHEGRLLRENLEREKMTEEELAASLRKHGIVEMAEIRQAVLEVDGEISIIQFDRGEAR